MPPGAQKARFRGTPWQHLSERGLEKSTPKEKALEIPIHIPLATHERERQMVPQASECLHWKRPFTLSCWEEDPV